MRKATFKLIFSFNLVRPHYGRIIFYREGEYKLSLTTFGSIKPVSPVKQDFIWLAEYADGTHLAEFDLKTKKENTFYEIERNKLIRFGLIGHGMKLYYEVMGGVFKLQGRMVEVIYKTKSKDYFLTGQRMLYNDIIQFKNAYAAFNPYNARTSGGNTITQFNFGYKQNLVVGGVQFGLRFLCHVPFGAPMYMSFRIVCGEDLEDGCVVVRRNNSEVCVLDAPLRKGVGGEFKWVLK